MSIVAQITLRLQQALVAAFGEDFAETDPMLAATNNPKFGDYQSNLALSLSKKLGQPPRQVAQAIVDQFEAGDMFETPELAGPGFINLRFKPSYLSSQLQKRQNDDRLGIAPTATPHDLGIPKSGQYNLQ